MQSRMSYQQASELEEYSAVFSTRLSNSQEWAKMKQRLLLQCQPWNQLRGGAHMLVTLVCHKDLHCQRSCTLPKIVVFNLNCQISSLLKLWQSFEVDSILWRAWASDSVEMTAYLKLAPWRGIPPSFAGTLPDRKLPLRFLQHGSIRPDANYLTYDYSKKTCSLQSP